jgi:hypothetical protein
MALPKTPPILALYAALSIGAIDERRGSLMTVLHVRGAARERPSGRSRAILRTIAAGPWLGLLLIFALSSLVAERAGPTPTQRNWVFGRLDSSHTFGQTFVALPGELIGVRVLLFANPGARDEPVTLRLRYAEGDLPELAVATLSLRELGRRDWTTFAIQPLALHLTATLRLDLEAPTLPSDDWITVMAGPDTYAGGELFAGSTSRPKIDLAFQPVYRRRWLDGVLPITRMALGKPGLLGWPPLYALLAYGSAVALARLLLALWRAVRDPIDAR